jgi:hypothetical protein
MPITITGDMTSEEVEVAMVSNLRELVASGTPTIQISLRQAQHLLDLIESSDKNPSKPKDKGK